MFSQVSVILPMGVSLVPGPFRGWVTLVSGTLYIQGGLGMSRRYPPNMEHQGGGLSTHP